MGLGEGGADELVAGRPVVGPARICERAAALTAAGSCGRGKDEPIKPVRAAAGRILGDRTLSVVEKAIPCLRERSGMTPEASR